MFTPQKIGSAEHISSFSLSKDGSSLVYAFGSLFKPTKSPKKSALWVADTSKKLSGKRLLPTSTNFNHSPTFHPISNVVYFLSDRCSGPNGPTHIYKFDGTEPQVIALFDNSETVSSYKISPDGSHIAFISTKRDDANKAEEIEVWGEKKTNSGSLRVISLNAENTEIRTLVSNDLHVASFVWSPDSTSIAYRLQRKDDDESRDFPVVEGFVSLDTEIISDIYTHSRAPNSNSVITSSKPSITAYLQSLPRDLFSSSSALYVNDFNNDEESILYGEIEDAIGMVDVQYNNQVAIEIWTGLSRRIDIVDIQERKMLFTLLEWKEEHSMGFDIRFDSANGQYIVAACRSSAVTGELPELWVLRTGNGTIDSLTKGIRLSDHHSAYKPDKAPVSRAFNWTSVDGEKVEGIISHPRDVKNLNTLPAVVFIHGGPYMAEHFGLYWGFLEWRTFLASNGYIVLAPNYRGSAGRGKNFAKTNNAIGALDWDDTHTMILEAIKVGLIDTKNLAIIGYSQGGFLTAWGCSRSPSKSNEYTFKAGVSGAGPTNWGSLAESSDRPDMEASLGGSAPWTPGEPMYLRRSPIKDACNVRCPMLFIHGRNDIRVPLNQSIAMVRGIERVSKAPKPQLVIYPREGHIFDEAAHVEDMYRRLLEFLDKYMK